MPTRKTFQAFCFLYINRLKRETSFKAFLTHVTSSNLSFKNKLRQFMNKNKTLSINKNLLNFRIINIYQTSPCNFFFLFKVELLLHRPQLKEPICYFYNNILHVYEVSHKIV